MTPLPVREIFYNPKLEMVYFLSYYGKNTVQGFCIDVSGTKRKLIIPREIYNEANTRLKEQDQLFKLIQDINSNLVPPHIIIAEYDHDKDTWKL